MNKHSIFLHCSLSLLKWKLNGFPGLILIAVFAIDWKTGRVNLNENLRRLLKGILTGIEITVSIQPQFYHVLITGCSITPSWPVIRSHKNVPHR